MLLANGLTAIVTVPAGKKYEVLESCANGTAVAAGPVIDDYDYDGVNALVANEGVAAAAGPVFVKVLYGNHLLEAGVTWFAFVLNTTGGMNYRLTYVDVDV